jgi:hypothetical protein
VICGSFAERVNLYLTDLEAAIVRGKLTTMSNPFYISGSIPSERFAGRDQMIGTAFDHIVMRRNAAFYGISGIGKSSLLRFISAESAWQKYGAELDISCFYPVFIDCLSIFPFTTQKFFRQILESLAVQLSENIELSALISSVLVQDGIDRGDLGRVLGQIERDKKTLLLLLDDFDCALAPHSLHSDEQILALLSDLRALAIHGSHFVTFITAYRAVFDISPPIVRNTPSPWYNQYSSNYLEPFDDREIEEIFFQSDSHLAISDIPEKLKAAVLAMTYGHPALLQHAGHLLHEAFQSKDDFPSPKIFAENLLVRTEHLFQNIWRCSTEKEQVLLMLFVINNQEGRRLNLRNFKLRNLDGILSQYAKELVYLKRGGTLIESADTWGKPQYAFASSIMEWWVLQEIVKDDGASLKKYEMVFLSLMNQEQMDNMKKICAHAWKAKDDLASFIERIIKMKNQNSSN